jgi:hypothetical protein
VDHEARLYEVLYYFNWWDCPRCGVTVVDGIPMHFESPFDERLDDYAPEFYLWPMSTDELAAADDLWHQFAAWRARFDAGEQPPPFEHTQADGTAQSWRHEPPATARRAVPEWQLDSERSFVGSAPQHRVWWRFLD